jgi:thiamine-phosphate pyrophosphorylase
VKKEMPKGLYAITAENFSNGRNNIEVVKEILDCGVMTIQYRDKIKTKSEKLRQCEIIRKLTQNYGAFFIVNDDADIALACNADGIHLGQDDMPIEEARKIAGKDITIGLSTHCPQQAAAAELCKADYIGVGPIFKTFTKENVSEPVGLEYLDYCVKNIKIHKVAIGGIKLSNLLQICSYKPESVCMVTQITSSQNIKRTIKLAMEIINGSR